MLLPPSFHDVFGSEQTACRKTVIILPPMGVCAAAFIKAFYMPADPLLHVVLASYGNDFTTLDELAHGLWMATTHASVILVGYSFGGFVAQCMQAAQPRRVLGLVLISTLSSAELRKRHAATSLKQLLRFQNLQHLQDVLQHPVAKITLTKDQRNVLANLVSSNLTWSEIQAQLTSAIHFTKVRPLDGTPPACPTLVIHGDGDGVISIDAARKFSKGLPNSVLVVVHGAKHDIMVTHMDQVRVILCTWLHMLGCDNEIHTRCPILNATWESNGAAGSGASSPALVAVLSTLLGVSCILVIVFVVLYSVHAARTKKGL